MPRPLNRINASLPLIAALIALAFCIEPAISQDDAAPSPLDDLRAKLAASHQAAVVPTRPAAKPIAKTANRVAGIRLRRMNFIARYRAVGARASTGSFPRNRPTSSAKLPADA